MNDDPEQMREAEQRACNLRHAYLEKRLCAEVAHLMDIMDEHEKRYMSMFASREEATKLALDAADRAVTKSEISVERRFDQVNEFKEQMLDERKEYMTRAEYVLQHASLSDKLDGVESRFTLREGSLMGTQQTSQSLFSQRNATVIWIFLGLALLVSIAGILLDLTVVH